MTARRRVLGVVIARGGSQGLPRKNLLPLAGKPLIVHTLAAAQVSRLLTRWIVSTDDPEIARVAREHGADVPFVRPAYLAEADSRAFDVLRHALDEVERMEGLAYDDVVLLQPTSPFRHGDDIDAALELLWRSGADSVITVYRHPQVHPFIMYRVDAECIATPFVQMEDPMLQRQGLPPIYIRTGLVYAFRRVLLQTGQNLYGHRTAAYVVPRERALCIDEAWDLRTAESQWDWVFGEDG